MLRLLPASPHHQIGAKEGLGGGFAANELIARSEGELAEAGGTGLAGEAPEWLDY